MQQNAKIPQVICSTVTDHVCNGAIREQFTVGDIVDFEKGRIEYN
jgi:hypothetical protein